MEDDDDDDRPQRRRVPGLEDYGVIGRDELQREIERAVKHAILSRQLITREQLAELLREFRESIREEIRRRWNNIGLGVSLNPQDPGAEEGRVLAIVLAWKQITQNYPGRLEKILAFLTQLFEENEASKGRLMRTTLWAAGVLSALATVTGALITILGHR